MLRNETNDASNIIKVNSTEVYVIGGSLTQPSLLAHKYDVPTSCLKINLPLNEVSQQSPMNMGRQCFALCHIGHHIYVVGGVDRNYEGYIYSCERYNMLTNKWTELSHCDLPGVISW